MAGGEGTTILETPPYVIALVFVFFLVISLGYEQLSHWIKHLLQKRGKHGLVGAMNNMQAELMALGLATLILLLFQSSLTDYCIKVNHYTRTWLDHVHGCSCCLSRTTGVSPCYYSFKGCVSEESLSECCTKREPKVCQNINYEDAYAESRNTSAYGVNANTGQITPEDAMPGQGPAPHGRRLQRLATMRALLAGSGGSDSAEGTANVEAQCVGRVQVGWPQCGYRLDQRPAIGPQALHQIHIFIFIIAIAHIIMGIFMIIIAGLRLRQWQHWKDQEDLNARVAAGEQAALVPLRIQQAVDDHSRAIATIDAAKRMESQRPDTVYEEGGDVDDFDPRFGKADSLSAAQHPTELPDTHIIEREIPWGGRPDPLVGCVGHAKELAVCLCRQFKPDIVTKQEFSLMRSAFILTHHIQSSSNFQYLQYLRNAMEHDFAEVVGLGLPMWIFIIIFVLLSSKIGWCIWIFVIISGVLLAIVNTKLVWIARFVTRGGHVHKLKPGIFWLNRPWLLLPVIKFLLFFVSFVYANAIFFATQFGHKSCFFSSVGFQGNPVPFWAIMVVNTVFAVSLSVLTLPLYSITVQMGGDFKASFLPKDVVENALRVHSLQAKKKGLRRLISTWLPKEREMQTKGKVDASEGSATEILSKSSGLSASHR